MEDKSIEQLELELNIKTLQDDTTVDAATKEEKLKDLQQQLVAMDNERYNQDISFQLRG